MGDTSWSELGLAHPSQIWKGLAPGSLCAEKYTEILVPPYPLPRPAFFPPPPLPSGMPTLPPPPAACSPPPPLRDDAHRSSDEAVLQRQLLEARDTALLPAHPPLPSGMMLTAAVTRQYCRGSYWRPGTLPCCLLTPPLPSGMPTAAVTRRCYSGSCWRPGMRLAGPRRGQGGH